MPSSFATWIDWLFGTFHFRVDFMIFCIRRVSNVYQFAVIPITARAGGDQSLRSLRFFAYVNGRLQIQNSTRLAHQNAEGFMSSAPGFREFRLGWKARLINAVELIRGAMGIEPRKISRRSGGNPISRGELDSV